MMAGVDGYGCTRQSRKRNGYHWRGSGHHRAQAAEEALREANEMTLTAEKAANTGSWKWELKTNRVTWSENLCRLHGIEPEDFDGKYETALKFIHPDDLEYVQKRIQLMFSEKRTMPFEYRIITADHVVKNVLGTNQMKFDEDGNVIETFGMVQDFTKHKQAEEALRASEKKLATLFGAMTEMVVLHELVVDDRGEAVDYRITDCNKAFTAVTGIQKADAVGKLATEVYQAESAPYLEEFSRVAITGEPYEFTVYYRPMDKHFKISVVSPQKGRFATITTDITTIKQIQEVVAAKNKELENYLYVASHDLRSPLINIQGFSQRLQKQTDALKKMLSEYPPEPEIKHKIQKITDEGIPKSLTFILTSVSKMDTLINGLLQVSRTGRMNTTIQTINVNNMMEKIISAFHFQIEEAAADVVVENMPACYGDAVLLNQLFSNIIGNALKYRDKNRPLVVTIAARTQLNKVIYSVQDTGAGIARRHLEKIWDVFYRVDSQSSEAGEGIGLSIVKRIADKNKGKIWVESEEGRGSVFYIELPGIEFSD